MTLICGTDFSDWGKAAQTAAAALAARLGHELWLVHALDPDVEVMGPDAREKVAALVSRRLEAEARALEGLAKGAVRTEVLDGRADGGLRDFARAKHAALVVVGSAGHGAGPLVSVGGTSERLAVGADVPVLVVRDGDPFAAWSHGAPLKVLVGVDDSAASGSAVRWVERLRAAGPVDVVVGCVYYADEARQRYGVRGRASFTAADPALEHLIERDLKRRVPTLAGRGELTYRARLGVGRVADHLLELAEAERCQLVVVGSHGRTGLARMWSVSAATLHLSRMSVAVVPLDGEPAGAFAAPPRLKRVLVTTDFSPLGDAAVPWAYTLVDAGGEVYLSHVTVVDPAVGELVDRYLPADAGPQTRSTVEAEVAARLRALVPLDAAERNVVTRTEVLRGVAPAKALVEAAERLGADAIVIASHGRTGLARTLLGSVAEDVLRHARAPVFVVRPPAR
jgi:nucleotide-binding universal stress UspA family protein